VAGILALLSTGSALPAQSIIMSYVTVGNPNNAPDPATGSLYGSVSYTYEIGQYDVTDSQYCTFLNDVDPTGANTLALYKPAPQDDEGSPQRNAEYGVTFNPGAANGSKYSVKSGYANMPVVNVDYWDALRFVNWMNNGEGSTSTETGAYMLLGGSTDGNGRPGNWESVTRNAGAAVWLPSENEWYKAAYYDPARSTYSKYATQSDTAPGNVIGSGTNEANYPTANGFFSVTQNSRHNSNQNYLTATGTFSGSKSHYGTYDQSGDVINWCDTVVASHSPVLRGGAWDCTSSYLSSSGGVGERPTAPGPDVGFRVASKSP